MEFRPRTARALLAEGGVAFVVVGGVAAAVRGSLPETTDLDVLIDPSPDNLAKLAAVLTEVEELVTFDTAVGEVDLLEVGKGGWTCERVVGGAEDIEIAGEVLRLISMGDLIAMRRAAGRTREIETAEELEALIQLEGRQLTVERIEPKDTTL